MLSLEEELVFIKQELVSQCYEFRPLKHFWIRDPKLRLISAAPFRDRVIHHALCMVLTPRFEKYYIFDSYACRKNKGLHLAIQRVKGFCHQHLFALKLDIEHFFENADHLFLKALIRRLVKDKQILNLIDLIIDRGHPRSLDGKGLAIGNLTSQYFANLYLSPLDHFIKQTLGIKGYVRYMDDMVIFGNDKESLWGWLFEINHYVENDLKLRLKGSVTEVFKTDMGIPFLGFMISKKMIRFDGKRKRRWIKNNVKLFKKYSQKRIKRCEFETKLASYQQWLNACTYPKGLNKAVFRLIQGRFDDC